MDAQAGRLTRGRLSTRGWPLTTETEREFVVRNRRCGESVKGGRSCSCAREGVLRVAHCCWQERSETYRRRLRSENLSLLPRSLQRDQERVGACRRRGPPAGDQQ